MLSRGAQPHGQSNSPDGRTGSKSQSSQLKQKNRPEAPFTACSLGSVPGKTVQLSQLSFPPHGPHHRSAPAVSGWEPWSHVGAML